MILITIRDPNWNFSLHSKTAMSIILKSKKKSENHILIKKNLILCYVVLQWMSESSQTPMLMENVCKSSACWR